MEARSPGGLTGEEPGEPVEIRRTVLVSGPPGAGKTTVARPLAKALGFALLSKDDIKEALYSPLGGKPGDVEFSRRVGAAAMEVLWALAPRCPRVVLEANFRTKSDYERGKVRELGGDVVEVFCRIPLDEASRRFAERAREERHHPAHALQELTEEQLMNYAEPFGLGPVIDLDTTRPVDVGELARLIRDAWRDPEDGGSPI